LITGNAHIEVLAPLGGGVELNGGSDSLGFCFKTTRFYYGADFFDHGICVDSLLLRRGRRAPAFTLALPGQQGEAGIGYRFRFDRALSGFVCGR
jgi:hypothetical protein